MDADTRDMVVRAFAVGKEISEKHVYGLFGQRPNGSQLGDWKPRHAYDFLDEINRFEVVPLDQLTPGVAMDGCVYFRSTVPHILKGAIEQIATLNTLDDEVKKTVRLNIGPHGPELVTSEFLPIRPAQELWLILGPVSETDKRLMPYNVIVGGLTRGLDIALDSPTTIESLIASGLPYGVKSSKDEPPPKA